MKIQLKILSLVLCLMFATVGLAETLDAKKKQRIDMLLDKTGGDTIARLVANQFIRLSSTSLQRTNPNIDPIAFEIIAEEVNRVIAAETEDKNTVREMLYPIWHQQLSLADINEIIAFYETPPGKKLLAVMPEITRESMAIAKSWGQSLAPAIRQRLEARFEQEGIKYR